MSENKGGRKPKRVINEEEKPELLAGIVLRAQSGESEETIAKAMGLSKHQVRTLKADNQYLEIVRKQKEESEKRIVSYVVNELENMAPLFVEGFKRNLQDGKPESQRLFVEMVGLKAKESGGTAEVGGIQIIMPGAEAPKTVEAEFQPLRDGGDESDSQ